MKAKANGSYTASLRAIVGCCALLLAALSVSSARADDVDYADGGTYLFQAPDIWIAAGRLGTGAWRQNSQNVVLRR